MPPTAAGENPSCICPEQDLKLLPPIAAGENPSCIAPQPSTHMHTCTHTHSDTGIGAPLAKLWT